MKLIRILLGCLALVAALAAVLVLLAIAPPVQTWIAQRTLANQAGTTGSLGSLSAGFGRVDVAGVRLETGGAVLTLPAREASVPLIRSLLGRRAIVRSLVAKGWTLDLSGTAAGPAAAATGAAVEKRAVQAFAGVLSGWAPPCGFSLDGVDLEGDVVLPSQQGRPPVRVHLTATGGGVTSELGGELSFDAESDNPGFSADSVLAHGRVAAQMGPGRSVRRLEVDADLDAKGGSLPEDLSVKAKLAVARGNAGESYTLDLGRGSRQLVEIVASYTGKSNRLEGSWKADLRDSDVAPFALGRTLPSFAVEGVGRYDADASLAQFHFTGTLKARAGRLTALSPALGRVGTIDLSASFDVGQEAHLLRVGSLEVAFKGDRPLSGPGLEGEVIALQPFQLDEATGALKVTDASSDLAKVRFQGLPLLWLPAIPGGIAFGGGAAEGGFAVRSDGGTLALRATEPFLAHGVSVRSAGGEIARDLDLSLAPSADLNAGGWLVKWSPLTVSRGGRQLGSMEGKASWPPGADEPVQVSGSWKADLDAMAGGAHPGAGRAASGEFTATVGSSASVDTRFTVAGHAADHSLAASVHADIDAYGGVTFTAPITIALGANVSQVASEGSWSRDHGVTRVDVTLTGDRATPEHLRLLTSLLAASAGVPLPGRQSGEGEAAGPRDSAPFWGSLVGSVKYSFVRLEASGHGLDYAGGVLEFEPGSIRLAGGHATLPHQNMARVEGQLAFDAASANPYRLKASASATGIDEASLYPPPPSGEQPPLEGRFSAEAVLTGRGANLADLARQTRGELRLASEGGIIRLLKTTVAEAIPESSAPVSDAVGTVGSAVGTIFGMKGGPAALGRNTVSKGADAVITFTYSAAEIGYDRLALTATLAADRTILLTGIEMTSPELRFKGSGTIGYAGGAPLSHRPLSVDLSFGARGDDGSLLATAGLLSPAVDEKGYTALQDQPVHFGGTVGQIDVGQWRDLLVRAATRKPETAKKDEKAGP
ncbi:MAG TPA: hypothetical protein VII43_01155 [Opitutaceae bacterium]